MDLSRDTRKLTTWFPTRSGTNHAVQPEKMARSLKFWIKEEEGLYCLCRENKGADQLCSYCEAALRLLFELTGSVPSYCWFSSAVFRGIRVILDYFIFQLSFCKQTE